VLARDFPGGVAFFSPEEESAFEGAAYAAGRALGRQVSAFDGLERGPDPFDGEEGEEEPVRPTGPACLGTEDSAPAAGYTESNPGLSSPAEIAAAFASVQRLVAPAEERALARPRKAPTAPEQVEGGAAARERRSQASLEAPRRGTISDPLTGDCGRPLALPGEPTFACRPYPEWGSRGSSRASGSAASSSASGSGGVPTGPPAAVGSGPGGALTAAQAHEPVLAGLEAASRYQVPSAGHGNTRCPRCDLAEEGARFYVQLPRAGDHPVECVVFHGPWRRVVTHALLSRIPSPKGFGTWEEARAYLAHRVGPAVNCRLVCA